MLLSYEIAVEYMSCGRNIGQEKVQNVLIGSEIRLSCGGADRATLAPSYVFWPQLRPRERGNWPVGEAMLLLFSLRSVARFLDQIPPLSGYGRASSSLNPVRLLEVY